MSQFNRRDFLASVARLGIAITASPLVELVPDDFMARWRKAYDQMDWKPPLSQTFPERIVGLEVDKAGELLIRSQTQTYRYGGWENYTSEYKP